MINFLNHFAQTGLLLITLFVNMSSAIAQGLIADSDLSNGKANDSALATISNLYSDIDMQVRLATKLNEQLCAGEQCILNQKFNAQVQHIGEQLALTAYAIYPDLKKRVPSFVFQVVDKKEAGMASNGAGKIIIFRGIQRLASSDDVIAFIIAREMGHVIGRHHDKNTSTKILFSVLAGVLFPAITLLSASNVAAQAGTGIATSVASTATSYFGSEAAISKIKPSQLLQSDKIAIKILDVQGWDMPSVASILDFESAGDNGWQQDLHTSDQYLTKLLDKAVVEIPILTPDSALTSSLKSTPIEKNEWIR